MGSQTVQKIRQRRMVCCNSANRGTAGSNFTHHEQSQKEALMVCGVSRAFFYAPVQHELFVELCDEAKKTIEDNNMCAATHERVWGHSRSSKLAPESPRNDGHTRFLDW